MNYKKAIRMTGSILSTIIMLASIAFCIVVFSTNIQAKQTGEEPFYFGYRPCRVLTGSMEPYMMTNSIFLSKEVDSIDELAVGDVVTYKVMNDAGKMIHITHRIQNISPEGIITTKGDNNNVADSFALTMENVYAKEVGVCNQPFVWFFNTWEQSNVGKAFIVSIALAIVILLYAIGNLLSVWLDDEEISESDVKEYSKLCRKLGIVPIVAFEEDLERLRLQVEKDSFIQPPEESIFSTNDPCEELGTVVDSQKSKEEIT